ncbi:amino acid permease [Bordetella genomosp. 1]|uniref:Amino acid permease n=1 Tax=Bordetella genomosp. 1 TaxID=1395607 RepID=A0A261SEL5_9BORD|nr:APC family permease [Bordetella genomosp. 1]OZI35447.1 amino acid permease [Bordetella genomosp. 1]
MNEPKTPVGAADPLSQFGYKQELSRSMSTGDLLIYGLIFMLPIAPWAIFGEVYNLSKGMVPLVYLLGATAMIFTALSYSQMARAFPLAGGVFSYVGRGINPAIGFFAGWLMLLDYLLTPTLLYIMAAESMVGILPGTPRWLWGVLFVVVNAAINLSGVTSLKRMNRVMLVIELAFVAAFIGIAVAGLMGHTLPQAAWSTAPLWNPEHVTPALVASALSIAVLSFLGFDGIATMAEESTGGARSPGRAMVYSLLIIGVLFVAQTWLASLLAGPYAAVPDDRIANFFFEPIRAIAGTGIVNAFFLCNVVAIGIANSLAAQAATSRLVYSMARDRKLPAFLAHVNRRKVPSAAILTVAGISTVLVIAAAGEIGMMSAMVNFGALSAFAVLHLAVMWYYLRKQGSRRWLSHLLLPVIGFVIIAYVLMNAGVMAQITGGIWLVIGIAVFFLQRGGSGGARVEADAAPAAQALAPTGPAG